MNVVNTHLNNNEFNVIYQTFIHILLISLNKLTHVFDRTFDKLPEIFALSFERHIFFPVKSLVLSMKRLNIRQ